MTYCGAVHPEHPESTCRLGVEEHPNHASRDHHWPNPEYSGPTMAELVAARKATRRGRRGTKAKMGTLVGPTATEQRPNGAQPGIPDAAAAKWDATAWVNESLSEVYDWLRHHPEEFTTAEAWWPLLDKPEEMRAMSRVVQRCTGDGLIEEVGAVRLNGVYRTRDGHEFTENKLVPIYRSRIATGA